MQYVSIMQEFLKIGRSIDPEEHRRQLEACTNLHLKLVAIFPDKGHLEPAVRLRLNERCSSQGPGAEWFKAYLEDVLLAVTLAVMEHRITCPGV